MQDKMAAVTATVTIASTAPADDDAVLTVFTNVDLLRKIVTFLPLSTLALTALQIDRAFCAAAQERLRQARPLLAPPFNMSPTQVLSATSFRLPRQRPHLAAAEMSALARAFASGAMPNVENLYLINTQISDQGLAAFTDAIAKAALPSLKVLDLIGNQIGDQGLAVLSDAIAKGAMPNLTRLDLDQNKVGDQGLAALADAIAKGTLPRLIFLTIGGNPASLEARSNLTLARVERERETSIVIRIVDR